MKSNNKVNGYVAIAVDLVTLGHNDSYIQQHLIENHTTTEEQASEIVLDAHKFLENEYDQDLRNVWTLHKSRYTKQINRLLAVEELDEKQIGISCTYEEWVTSRERKIKAYLKAMDTMKQLEHLYQLHNTSVSVDIDEKLQVNVDDKKPKYDFSKLTLEEKVELLELIKLTKVNENDPQSVSEAISSPSSVTNVIVPDAPEEVNIAKIRVVESEPESNSVGKVDPTSILRERLKVIAARKFQKIGGNLDEIEKGYAQQQ